MAEATSLLKSLSVPEPLRSQLVQKSRLGFMLILDADGLMELIGYHPSTYYVITSCSKICSTYLKMSQNIPKCLNMSNGQKCLKNIEKNRPK